jgi:hypothetical protein
MCPSVKKEYLKDILANITSDQAVHILKVLWEKRSDVREIIGLHEEEKLYCMGVLKGLYRFDKEAKSEFRDWASDAAGECFEFVLKKWQKQKGNERFAGEMDEFIKVTCPKWARQSRRHEP